MLCLDGSSPRRRLRGTPEPVRAPLSSSSPAPPVDASLTLRPADFRGFFHRRVRVSPHRVAGAVKPVPSLGFSPLRGSPHAPLGRTRRCSPCRAPLSRGAIPAPVPRSPIRRIAPRLDRVPECRLSGGEAASVAGHGLLGVSDFKELAVTSRRFVASFRRTRRSPLSRSRNRSPSVVDRKSVH